jgi:hypothetical protein
MYILVSQIVSSCKIFDKNLWMYSCFILENHMSCPVILAYITLSNFRKEFKLWSLCHLFFSPPHSCYFFQSKYSVFIILIFSSALASSSVEAVYGKYIVWQNILLIDEK